MCTNMPHCRHQTQAANEQQQPATLSCHCFLLLLPFHFHAFQSTFNVVLEKLSRCPQKWIKICIRILQLEIIKVIQTLNKIFTQKHSTVKMQWMNTAETTKTYFCTVTYMFATSAYAIRLPM